MVAQRAVPDPRVHGVGPSVLAEVQLVAEQLVVEPHDQHAHVSADVYHDRTALWRKPGLVLAQLPGLWFECPWSWTW